MATPALAFDRIATECERDGLTPDNAQRLATELARTFGVHEDEVAILRIERQNLIFAYPLRLHNVGTIPLNDAGSVAARTVNSRKAVVINNFAQAKHATIFETIELTHHLPGTKYDRQAHVIQKLMSCPVMGAEGAVGVIQLSHKGPSAPEAGADFTAADLQRLVTIATPLGKCFR